MKKKILRKHYKGDVAQNYEQGRSHTQKWQDEQNTVAEILRQLPEGLKLIDAPVGTGRFFEVYAERQLNVEGVDVSSDMLAEAAKQQAAQRVSLVLKQGDIFKLGYADGAFDVALCIRFFNLVNEPAMARAMRELARVSNRYLIVGVRHLVPVGELNLKAADGIEKLARQCVSRVIALIKRKIFFQKRKYIAHLFDVLRLKVVARHCVETRKDGTDYYIYLLEKQG
jgi:ubiquinone/menaquinone biosynthesis C-methylase UbiE